jgi:KipI family sensor histidine kinase inhibitor
MIYERARFLNSGDQFLTVEIGDEMSLKANFRVIAIDKAVKRACVKGLIETLPGWRSIMIHYESLTISTADLVSEIQQILEKMPHINSVPSRFIELPVKYGGRWGKDIEFVAKENKISSEELVRIHSETVHWVGMVGFTPGSPQLMQINPSFLLSVPKYTSPRLYTPLGTIGIGGSITAIYPVVSPGGYQMIGLTPVPIFDRYQSHEIFEKSPVLLKIGDRVKFKRIENDDEMDFIRQQIVESTYKYSIKEEEFFL